MKHALAVFVALVLAAPPSFAGEPVVKEKEGGENFLKELNLTPDQQKKVKEVREKYRPQIKEKRTAVKAAREDLKAAMKATEKGPTYQATLLTKFKSVQTLENERQALRFQMALDMREILNPDQIAKFKGAMGGHHGKKGRWGKHKRRGGDDADSDGKEDEI